jgi:hypothetical protein
MYAQWIFENPANECGYQSGDSDMRLDENLTSSPPIEILPEFPGGEDSLFAFIHNHLNNNHVSGCGTGKVYVQFIIDTLGTFSKIMLRKGYCLLNDQEALRIVSIMPKWVPGIYNGKKTSFQYTIPIIFNPQ